MRPKRSRLPAVQGFFFPRAITRWTFHWITVVTPAGHAVQIRDDIPHTAWPALLEAFDLQYPWSHERRRERWPLTKYRRVRGHR